MDWTCGEGKGGWEMRKQELLYGIITFSNYSGGTTGVVCKGIKQKKCHFWLQDYMLLILVKQELILPSSQYTNSLDITQQGSRYKIFNKENTHLPLHLTDSTKHAHVLQNVSIRQQLFSDLLIQRYLTSSEDLVHSVINTNTQTHKQTKLDIND